MLTIDQAPGLGEDAGLTILSLCCLAIFCPLPLRVTSHDPPHPPWPPLSGPSLVRVLWGQTSALLHPKPLLPLSGFFPVFPTWKVDTTSNGVPFSALPLPTACSLSLTQACRLWNLSLQASVAQREVQVPGPTPRSEEMCALPGNTGPPESSSLQPLLLQVTLKG